MKSKTLTPLLFTQFVGAFNDNAWKLIVFALATRSLAGGVAATQQQATLGMAVFLVPMLLVSLAATLVVDRISKRRLIIWTKGVEVVLMAAAAVSLLLAPTKVAVPYTLLALMGAQSALFSPAKYGIIPDLVTPERLSWSNGLLEMWSMAAIIAGTCLGPLLLVVSGSASWLAPSALALFSSMGLAAAFRLPHTPKHRSPTKNGNTFCHAWRAIRADRALYLSVIGGTVYWLVFSLLGQQVLVYAKLLMDKLGRGDAFTGLAPAAFGVGIGIGAYTSGRLSRAGAEYGFIPAGTSAFTALSLLLGVLEPNIITTVMLLIPMGAAAGAVAVPLNSISQQRAPAHLRGAILGISNTGNLIGMIGGSALAAGMAQFDLPMRAMLLLSSGVAAAAMAWTLRLLLGALIRLACLFLIRLFSRITIRQHALVEAAS